MNRDAPGLGRGGGLGFFFGRGSRGGAGKPFGFAISCPFVCSGGMGFSVLLVDAVAVALPSAPCSDSELAELTRLRGGFTTSLGLINSGI